MKRNILIIGIGLLLAGLVFSAPAMAQDEDSGSDTMQVVQPDQEPEEVDKRITLPDSASEQGVESSKQGLETANEGRSWARSEPRKPGKKVRNEPRKPGKWTGSVPRKHASEPRRPGSGPASGPRRPRSAMWAKRCATRPEIGTWTIRRSDGSLD